MCVCVCVCGGGVWSLQCCLDTPPSDPSVGWALHGRFAQALSFRIPPVKMCGLVRSWVSAEEVLRCVTPHVGCLGTSKGSLGGLSD